MQDVLCTAHSNTAAVLVTRWSADMTPTCLVPDCWLTVGGAHSKWDALSNLLHRALHISMS